MKVFEKILGEKQVIDPVIWLLKIQFIYVEEDHKEYIQAMTSRWKNNPKIMKELQKHFSL
ncbi:hypothetical protein P4576_17085 [Peribacillus frigoritolerans]|uniref:hypothetical protein n=1 Tax=Peribacillus frigoritolerans TaxID=450367 RepID=UPI002E1B093E|nr:hypothetical protein [Peribacillus frigoritolerans]